MSCRVRVCLPIFLFPPIDTPPAPPPSPFSHSRSLSHSRRPKPPNPYPPPPPPAMAPPPTSGKRPPFPRPRLLLRTGPNHVPFPRPCSCRPAAAPAPQGGDRRRPRPLQEYARASLSPCRFPAWSVARLFVSARSFCVIFYFSFHFNFQRQCVLYFYLRHTCPSSLHF